MCTLVAWYLIYMTNRTEWCQLPTCSEEFTPTEGAAGDFCSMECEEQYERETHDAGDCAGAGFCELCNDEEMSEL